MCRIGSIKSKHYIHPSLVLKLMRSQQKGHDNSGFAFIMQDLGGIFENYKDLPILSMAVTDEGMKYAEDLLHQIGFVRVFQYNPEVFPDKSLRIETMPNYVFEVFQYPKNYKNATREEKEELLLNTRLKLRSYLEKNEEGFVYSFWEDVISLKEIVDIAKTEDRNHYEALAARIYELGGELPDDLSVFYKNASCPPANLPADKNNTIEIIKILRDAEQCAMAGYNEICKMTFDKDFRTYDLSLAILHEETEHESWFSEFLGEGPSGHFMRKGESSPFVRKFLQ